MNEFEERATDSLITERLTTITSGRVPLIKEMLTWAVKHSRQEGHIQMADEAVLKWVIDGFLDMFLKAYDLGYCTGHKNGYRKGLDEDWVAKEYEALIGEKWPTRDRKGE